MASGLNRHFIFKSDSSRRAWTIVEALHFRDKKSARNSERFQLSGG
jgi:hypothetical protein